MAGAFATVARFPTSIEAHLARNHLADHGIEAWVTNDAIADMAWHLITAIGWVKVLVRAECLPRARGVLEGKQADQAIPRALFASIGCEELAALAGDDGNTGARGQVSPRERLAGRAILATLGSASFPFGFLVTPLAAWLLWKVAETPGKLGPWTWCWVWLAAAVLFPHLLFAVFLVGGLVYFLVLDNIQIFSMLELSWEVWRKWEGVFFQ